MCSLEINSLDETGKTSNDILAELFSTFDAVPPVLTEFEGREGNKKEHKSKKSKKSKKKHKKHKRKKRESSLDSKGSASDEIKPKRKKVDENDSVVADQLLLSSELKIKQEPQEKTTETASNSVKDIDKPSGLLTEKKNKIRIPDLTNSVVYRESLKAVNEKKEIEQERKSKLEDGELSDNSDHCKNGKEEAKGSRERKRSYSKTRRSDNSSKRDERHRLPRHENSPRRSRDSRTHVHRHSEHGHSRIRDARHQIEALREDHNRSDRSHKRPKTPEIKHRRRSLERSRDVDKIDKEKLLEIARRNAKRLISAGVVSNNKLVSITSGGKSVSELTEYCKKLSKREALGEEFSDVESGSSDEDKLFHHPFQVKERPNSIVMNIKNAIALPVVKSLTEKAIEQSKQLTLQFPVSSGSTHRLTENEWVPVEPVKPPVKANISAPLAIEAPPPAPTPPPPLPSLPLPTAALVPMPNYAPVMPILKAVVPPMPYAAIPPPMRPTVPVIQPTVTDMVTTNMGLDINDIVTKRLDALRKLQENPKDRSAKQLVSRTQTQLDRWTREKRHSEPRVETGEFRGSTGARILSVAELGSGQQAWAKRDQLISAQPVKSGMGMAMLQKMGWQPGEGLGKNKEGSLEPLKLEVKTDKKGLVAVDESWKGKTVGLALPTVKTLDGKHPVSLLNEYCTRRRWGQPVFELAFECGPDHKKTFLFKVKVNNIEYQPNVASVNKKQAKAEAAAIALRSLGLITGPTEAEIAAGIVSKL